MLCLKRRTVYESCMSALTLTSGLRLLSRREYKAVHTDAISAIHADVRAALPYFLLGVIASDHGKPVKALALFETAIDYDPEVAHYSAYRAMTLSILRRSKAARIIRHDRRRVFPLWVSCTRGFAF